MYNWHIALFSKRIQCVHTRRHVYIFIILWIRLYKHKAFDWVLAKAPEISTAGSCPKSPHDNLTS